MAGLQRGDRRWPGESPEYWDDSEEGDPAGGSHAPSPAAGSDAPSPAGPPVVPHRLGDPAYTGRLHALSRADPSVTVSEVTDPEKARSLSELATLAGFQGESIHDNAISGMMGGWDPDAQALASGTPMEGEGDGGEESDQETPEDQARRARMLELMGKTTGRSS